MKNAAMHASLILACNIYVLNVPGEFCIFACSIYVLCVLGEFCMFTDTLLHCLT